MTVTSAEAALKELGDERNTTEVDFDGLGFDSHDRMSVGNKEGHSEGIKRWEGFVIPGVKVKDTFPSRPIG